MSDRAKHTPTPWTVQYDGQDIYIQAEYNGDGIKTLSGTFTIAHLTDGFGVTGNRTERDANARLLVRAVNAHEAMREALRAALPALENYSDELNAMRYENAEKLARRFRGRSGDSVHRLADKARAALALADGEGA
jgi:hypothetical protein